MSFGVGVGDIIAVSKIAKGVWRNLADSPAHFKAIRAEVAGLKVVLDDVAETMPKCEIGERESRDLGSLVQGCHRVLTDLDTMLRRYESLGSNPQGLIPRLHNVRNKVKWDQNEARDLRSRIISNTALLDAFNASLARKQTQIIKDSVDRLNYRVEEMYLSRDQDWRREIIDWVSPLNFSAQQNDFISKRQEGTGLWLLESNEYKMWLDGAHRLLFCPGIPGAGKTMLASIVVDHLQSEFPGKGIGIAYLYYDYKRRLEQEPANLIGSLLKQLVKDEPLAPGEPPGDLKSLYDQHRRRQTRPSLEEISRVLHSEINKYSRVFIINDGLDECPEDARRTILLELHKLELNPTTSLLVTSRFIPAIAQEFKESLQLEIRASSEDVRTYLGGQLLYLPKCVQDSAELQEFITTNIVTAVDGMFLLAQLHLDSLAGKTSIKAIKTALRNLPKGSKALDVAYDEAIERINSQKGDFPDLARMALFWIAHARRPLTTRELQHALAVEVDEPELDEENFSNVEEIVSACAGLVTVDKESDIIRLVHYTTQEYFEQNRGQLLITPAVIASICLTYLSFDTFASGCCPTRDVFENRVQQYAFLDYAAKNWGHHIRGDLEEGVKDRVLKFLESDSKVACSSQVIFGQHPDSSAYPVFAGVHLAAYFGLWGTMAELLKNGSAADSKDNYCRTPLWWAARNGHEAVMELLFERDIDLDCEDIHGFSPLRLAASNGRVSVVKLLLERGAEPDSEDTHGYTPLWWAVRCGHEATVELLLEQGADPKHEDKSRRTPLWWAANGGHEAMVKLLLEKGVNPNSKDKFGQTALSRAATYGSEGVVKLLLENGANPDSKDGFGWTALSWAAHHGREAMVKLLVEGGADPAYTSNDSQGAASQEVELDLMMLESRHSIRFG